MAKHYLRSNLVGAERVGGSITLYRRPDRSVTLAANGPADAIGLGVSHDEIGRYIEHTDANASISENELIEACASILA